jgi:ribosome maturation factor RimP
MLKFSRLHSDSFLVYDNKNNHIGELYRTEESDWKIKIEDKEHGVEYTNVIDAKRAAEHIVMREFEPDPYDVGC